MSHSNAFTCYIWNIYMVDIVHKIHISIAAIAILTFGYLHKLDIYQDLI